MVLKSYKQGIILKGDFMIRINLEDATAVRNYSLKGYMLGKGSREILHDFLSQINPLHSILINDEVGIADYNENSDSNTGIIDIDGMDVIAAYRTKNKGNEFTVITTDGILFHEKINHVYLLYSGKELIGYLFKLVRMFDDCFGGVSNTPAYIFYDLHDLYTNKFIVENEELKEYKICEVEELADLNSVRINNKLYYGYCIDDGNIVSVMNSSIFDD